MILTTWSDNIPYMLHLLHLQLSIERTGGSNVIAGPATQTNNWNQLKKTDSA